MAHHSTSQDGTAQYGRQERLQQGQAHSTHLIVRKFQPVQRAVKVIIYPRAEGQNDDSEKTNKQKTSFDGDGAVRRAGGAVSIVLERTAVDPCRVSPICLCPPVLCLPRCPRPHWQQNAGRTQTVADCLLPQRVSSRNSNFCLALRGRRSPPQTPPAVGLPPAGGCSGRERDRGVSTRSNDLLLGLDTVRRRPAERWTHRVPFEE